jgi:hypothetical protein
MHSNNLPMSYEDVRMSSGSPVTIRSVAEILREARTSLAGRRT